MKPEPKYGRDDIRYCHYCLHWDGNVYTLDAYGRKRLVHKLRASESQIEEVKLMKVKSQKINNSQSFSLG